jgi:uncharacterized protein (TIGR03437 family)
MRTRTGWNASRILLIFAWASLTWAQSGTTPQIPFKVEASNKSAMFWVDGKDYQGTAQFFWPEGSRHTLEVRKLIQTTGFGSSSRLTFNGWIDSTGLLQTTDGPVQIITATSKMNGIGLSFALEHRVDIWVNYDPLVNLTDPDTIDYRPISDIELPQRANSYGYILGDASLCGSRGGIPTSTWVWRPDGTAINLQAIPYPGKVFSGWDLQPGLSNSYLGTFTVKGPTAVRAKFSDARRYYINSFPIKELKVIIDRTTIYTRGDRCYNDGYPWQNPVTAENPSPGTTPFPNSSVPSVPDRPAAYCTQIPLCNGELDLEPGTQHIFAAPPSQTDRLGNLWIFDHWDFGNNVTGGQNTVVTVPSSNQGFGASAYFVKGVRSSFVTVPSNLKLKIDGRDNWASYNFEWGVGHTHKLSAPLEQVDSKGRKYRFVKWSNDGPADQDVVIPDDGNNPGSYRLVATYELLGQLKVFSEPSALTLNLGGTECKTPCTLDRPAGTELSLATVPELPLTDESKVVFAGWQDGVDTTSRSYTFSTDVASYTARYRYLNKFTPVSDPEKGAEWTYDPNPETGGYFQSGTKLQVTAKALPGFKFKRFEGALSGSYNTGWLTMNAPATVVAKFDKVPALAKDAVKNAVGETPDLVVAPGSLISIRGYNMAPAAETGPSSPLTQTLQGVVVQMTGRILPLVSVNPEEIIAFLPSDIAEGTNSLTVRSPGQPALTATFEVTRNAPGLFRAAEATDELPLALALHEDGSAVTVEAPAVQGEVVSLLGTGFGPVDPSPLDGFAVPDSPAFSLKDTLEFYVGQDLRAQEWAGAAAGRVGYSLLKVKIDPLMGEGQNVTLKVKVNGRESNSVILPLK